MVRTRWWWVLQRKIHAVIDCSKVHIDNNKNPGDFSLECSLFHIFNTHTTIRYMVHKMMRCKVHNLRCYGPCDLLVIVNKKGPRNRLK